MNFEAWIDGREMACRVTVDTDIAAPVFCFSCMAPVKVLSGGTRIAHLGGYTEVQLPDLTAGVPHELRIEHAIDRHVPGNRGWLPLGGYLRHAGGLTSLPILPAGVSPKGVPRPAGSPPEVLVCPQPAAAQLTGEVLETHGFDIAGTALNRAVDWATRCGLDLHEANGTPLAVTVDESLPAEAYRLTIGPEGAALSHGDAAGAFYGGVTLATLLRTHRGQIPCGVIEDAPRFEWRGQHLDCARHFYSVETILRLLDLLALLKMNRFHWHFADDEAFRLHLASLPELAGTHQRGEGHLLPGVFGGGISSGGGYTRADAARVIAHAKALHIEVMPEIEVPAHALAIAKIFPGTRDPSDTGAEASVQGYPENVMNPAQEESWRIWQAMATEVAEIFPFHVLHLGGDELPPGTWQGSPAAEALKTAEGLTSTQDLQGWTMFKLAGHVQSSGKSPAAWEEAALGARGIEHDAILFSWTGQGPGLQAARDGYSVVMCPGQKVYLDMAQTPDPSDWGATWAAIVPLSETINWDPVPDDEPELEARIIGVEGTFWSEFTTRDVEMEPMLAPRILGVATMAWQPRGSADQDALHGLAEIYGSVFDFMGWNSTVRSGP